MGTKEVQETKETRHEKEADISTRNHQGGPSDDAGVRLIFSSTSAEQGPVEDAGQDADGRLRSSSRGSEVSNTVTEAAAWSTSSGSTSGAAVAIPEGRWRLRKLGARGMRRRWRPRPEEPHVTVNRLTVP